MSSSTSGAPCPKFAHSSGESANPCSYARSVHQTTPVEALVGSRPAWERWPSWALRNCRWIVELVSTKGSSVSIYPQKRIRLQRKSLQKTESKPKITRSGKSLEEGASDQDHIPFVLGSDVLKRLLIFVEGLGSPVLLFMENLRLLNDMVGTV